MVNRSKKVVLSARVDPYLKASLELAAVAKNQKIVKMLESILESGLEDLLIDNPFQCEDKYPKINFMQAFAAIWSENEALYKLRAGTLGIKFAGEDLAFTAMVVNSNSYFNGDFDLFGDLNGHAARFKPHCTPNINLELVEKEWPTVERYVSFLATNKPFQPSYDDFKRMLSASESK